MKRKITSPPVLAHFNLVLPITLQADSSQDGLGAVLLQQETPIEYTSRSLTPSERNWAQTEKELLSVVYGLEHFDQGRLVCRCCGAAAPPKNWPNPA